MKQRVRYRSVAGIIYDAVVTVADGSGFVGLAVAIGVTVAALTIPEPSLWQAASSADKPPAPSARNLRRSIISIPLLEFALLHFLDSIVARTRR